MKKIELDILKILENTCAGVSFNKVAGLKRLTSLNRDHSTGVAL